MSVPAATSGISVVHLCLYFVSPMGRALRESALTSVLGMTKPFHVQQGQGHEPQHGQVPAAVDQPDLAWRTETVKRHGNCNFHFAAAT